MKIKETVERECCAYPKDLKPYKGIAEKDVKYMFCVHCGQIWGWNRKMDAAGSMSDTLVKIRLLWNQV